MDSFTSASSSGTGVCFGAQRRGFFGQVQRRQAREGPGHRRQLPQRRSSGQGSRGSQEPWLQRRQGSNCSLTRRVNSSKKDGLNWSLLYCLGSLKMDWRLMLKLFTLSWAVYFRLFKIRKPWTNSSSAFLQVKFHLADSYLCFVNG